MIYPKQFLIKYYYEVIHWQIKLAIYQIRNDKYAQKEYWINELKERLIKRDQYILKIINHIEIKPNVQLELF